MRRGLLFIVSAPSGTGKTTLVRQLVRCVPQLVQSRSYTSRPPRPGERDGVDYHFVDARRFEAMAAAGDFLEWAELFGHRYGTGAADTERERRAGRDVVLVIDVQGAEQIRESGVDAVSIFVLPPSLAALRQRLRGRGAGDAAQLADRLRAARRELGAAGGYDYVVTNDDLDLCVAQIRSIISAERCRPSASGPAIGRIVAALGAAGAPDD